MEAVDPQAQFNHKLLIFHGASCGVEHQTGTAPGVTGGVAGYALGRGFMTMSTALDNSGHNCNLPLQAESLIMAKEHIAKTYGTLRYTIGTGCSGGSLAQQWIANAYPGVYQGILPTCSFPDAWSTATQFLDYHLLLGYFNDPTKWATGVAWTPTQIADVEGNANVGNAVVSETAQFHVAVPTDPCAGVTAAQRYEPKSNPGGVRCDIQDAAINVFGPRPPADWSPNEQLLGHGFAGAPIDNVGAQYGLDALEKGQITVAQFVDLNAKIGGIDIDTNPTSGRTAATMPALANAYRSGMINETNNLDRTAIIDCRGPNPGIFHDTYRAFAIRARLDREHGTHANQLIWEGPAPLIADTQCERNSFIAMDGWLAAVEGDGSSNPLAQKLIADKPADLGDRCYDGAGNKVSDGLCPDAVVPVYGTPRTVAGDAITTDTNKCQLKPLNRDGYTQTIAGVTVPVTFSDAQWAADTAGVPRRRLRLLEARRRPAGHDPLADLPGRRRRCHLRGHAARSGAGVPAGVQDLRPRQRADGAGPADPVLGGQRLHAFGVDPAEHRGEHRRRAHLDEERGQRLELHRHAARLAAGHRHSDRHRDRHLRVRPRRAG